MDYVEFKADVDILKDIRDNSTKAGNECFNDYMEMQGVSYLKCRQVTAMTNAYRCAAMAMRHHQLYHGGPLQ